MGLGDTPIFKELFWSLERVEGVENANVLVNKI
jgi:hypothetical protein